ncbi:hypothetical protein ACD591_08985 [Rufibacter glacialis]|uniref:Uncharacterized protein n=1 Tax=Rufibacter glacialis TaxID=1259555 RepID=A0A5M8QC14_9BACT|nr:hypothetical protein [Rufibacter glacialis]KAA6432430.1 hypothetical protein FOE74_15125 [Rufibacter glacialis]GGK78598.1 hypothetical protein GCM10011405_28090 [Rufibacter glacialis]
MTEEEFDAHFAQTLDAVLVSLAESPDVDLEKFYTMTCFMENLRFFSPVLYSALKEQHKP